jgi:hypothetical protein
MVAGLLLASSDATQLRERTAASHSQMSASDVQGPQLDDLENDALECPRKPQAHVKGALYAPDTRTCHTAPATKVGAPAIPRPSSTHPHTCLHNALHLYASHRHGKTGCVLLRRVCPVTTRCRDGRPRVDIPE